MRLVFCLELSGSSSFYKPEFFYGRGLGGGECALYLLTRQLAKMGHRVEVYSPARNGQEYGGVYHLNIGQLDPAMYCDAFILFRSPNHLLYSNINTPARLFWSVDQQTQGDYQQDIFPYVDHTVTISPYHTKYHIGRYGADPKKIGHIDLGVNLEDYEQNIEKIPGRLIYTSVEVRGLWHLPRLYQHIKEARPGVSLVVTADYTLWGASFTGLERAPQHFGHLRDVTILGAVPRRELVRQQLQADILAYPCTYEELFCAVGETGIQTPLGLTALKDIGVGDLVIAGDNQSANSVISKYILLGPNDIITINTLGSNIPLQVGAGHRLWAVKGENGQCRPMATRKRRRKAWNTNIHCKPEWIRADRLRPGDILLRPIPRQNGVPPIIDLLELTTGTEPYKDKIRMVYGNVFGEARRLSTIPHEMPVDNPQLMHLLGLYIAEGSTSNGSATRPSIIHFTIHEREENLATEIESSMYEFFGLGGSRCYRRNSKALQLSFCSRVLAEIFDNLVGHGARQKHLPIWWPDLSRRSRLGLLAGMVLGDGHICKTRGRNGGSIRYSTSSAVLAQQAQDLFASVSIASALKRRISSKWSSHPSWIIVASGEQLRPFLGGLDCDFTWNRKSASNIWIHDGYLHLPITEVQRRRSPETLYDITLDGDNTYLTRGIISHNCLSIAEAQVAGAIPVTTDIGAINTTLDTGFLIPLRPGMPQYDKWFVDKIVGLLSDRAELERLQKEACQKAIKRFSYERIANEWIALIQKLQGGKTVEVTKTQCEYRSNGKRCNRATKGEEKYCWQHKAEMVKRPEVLHPTDLINRITKRGKIIHLRCTGHRNILELQLSQLPNVHCIAGDDPGEIDKDTSIILLDVLPLWNFEDAKERISAWVKAGAEIIAFLPLMLRQYQIFGQVRSWTKEELESLGFEVEALEGFHALPEGLVSAAWGIR